MSLSRVISRWTSSEDTRPVYGPIDRRMRFTLRRLCNLLQADARLTEETGVSIEEPRPSTALSTASDRAAA